MNYTNEASMIDTHAHLMSCKRSLDDLVSGAKARSVDAIINVGMDINSSVEALEMNKRYSFLYPTAGIHPCNREDFDRCDELQLLLEKHHNFVAIGETGLDYYWDASYKTEQIDVFRFQLTLARQLSLPVIIHNRQADDDLVMVLSDFHDVHKVIHCFSGSLDLAKTLLQDHTTLLSFTASITYSKKGKTLDALKHIPLEKIMIETDSPFITPACFKGNENQPAYVFEVAKRIADIKDIDVYDVIKKTTSTAKRFFNI